MGRLSLLMVGGGVRLVTWLARVVPLRASYGVARMLGLAAYCVWVGGRRRSEANMLRVAGGDRGLARRYARRSFSYYGTYLIDFLRFGSITPREVRERVLFEDWPRIERERTGNGILFVTMHFGNWDLAGAAIANHGLPLTVIADTFGHEAINRLVVESRRRLGMTIVPAERMGAEVLRALRRNDVVAALADIPRANGGAGVSVEFFGEVVAIPDGPARIALRSGAPIMVGGAWRRGPLAADYWGDVERVEFEASGDRERDVVGLTQAMMYALERLILRAPEQWYIFRRLWVGDSASADGARESVA
jgi:KDO2-lipid IV(A) lauroyltransferase